MRSVTHFKTVFVPWPGYLIIILKSFCSMLFLYEKNHCPIYACLNRSHSCDKFCLVLIFKKVMMSMKLSNKVGSFVRNSSPRVRPMWPSSENVFNVRKSSLPPYLRKKCIVQGPVFQKFVKLIQYLG